MKETQIQAKHATNELCIFFYQVLVDQQWMSLCWNMIENILTRCLQ